MFHLAVGNLRCFDARQNTEDKEPYFNFYDRDALHAENVRLVDLTGNNRVIVVLQERLISPQIRAMIDNVCYMSVYGHQSMLESRLPLSRISGFAKYALKAARDNEADFYESWKRHLATASAAPAASAAVDGGGA